MAFDLFIVSSVNSDAADRREIAVTDIAQIVGLWEGTATFMRPVSTPRGYISGTVASLVTIRKDGTWEGGLTHGKFMLQGGKVRFEVLSQQPPDISKTGSWVFYETDGRLSSKATRDDGSIIGEYTKK